MMFKHNFQIEETGQEISLSLIETESEYKEFHIKISSKSTISGMDLAHCLAIYAEHIYSESKPPEKPIEEENQAP